MDKDKELSDPEESEDYSDSSLSNVLGLGEGMTDEQKKLIEERMRSLKMQSQIFNVNQKNQKVADVQKHYPQLDEKAVLIGLESVNNNEILLMRRFVKEENLLQTLQNMSAGIEPIDMEAIRYTDPKKVKVKQESSSSSEDEREDWRYASRPLKKSRQDFSSESEDNAFTSSFESIYAINYRPKRRRQRIRLNDAMQRYEQARPKPKNKSKSRSKRDEDDTFFYGNASGGFAHTGNQEIDYAQSIDYFHRTTVSSRQLHDLGWSDARIKAFKGRFHNPNQYYYRFNDPGEQQETGPWSPRDRFLFLKTLLETGLDYSWGTFSRSIPGRVGYQCSNYYRQLIKEGVIIDDNYFVDNNNQLTYRFRNRGNTKKTTYKRRSEPLFSDNDANEGGFYEEDANCLPGFIDVMTMAEVVRPAISPYGHVLGYDSWVKLLNREPKNTCPFTKQKLNRRQLVKLTLSNIDEYRDKIVQTTSGIYFVYYKYYAF